MEVSLPFRNALMNLFRREKRELMMPAAQTVQASGPSQALVGFGIPDDEAIVGASTPPSASSSSHPLQSGGVSCRGLPLPALPIWLQHVVPHVFRDVRPQWGALDLCDTN